MRYRVKLFVTVFLTVVLINGLTLTVMYWVASRELFKEIGNNALSVAATTAAFVDGEEHKNIQIAGDEKKPSFVQIANTLKKARDANRRDDTWVENLYTMKPMVGTSSTLAYGVDCEESRENKSGVDQALKITKGRIPVLGQQGVDRDDFSADQWGQWLSANVPVKDRSGNLVAAVGVDLPASFVQAKLNRLKYAGFLCLCLGIVSAAVVGVVLSGRAARPVRSLRQTMEAIEKGNLDAPADAGRRDEFGVIATAVNTLAKCKRENEAMKSAFTSYVSSQELKKLLETGMPPTVQTERRRITVLFSDIREFTRISESMRPEEVAQLLNEYFEKMVEVVFRHQGMIDKFIGDGLMALFGMSDDDRFQEEHAVSAALEMQQELLKLSEKWSKEGRPPMRIGIGINSGNAIVGNLGSEQRLEYTAIGDTVNLASRLESATKDYNADVLISEYTFNALRGAPFDFTKKGEATLKGRRDKVMLYAVAHKAKAVTVRLAEAIS
jgi:adenylate cyclase